MHHLLGCAFLADRNIEEGSTAEIYIQKVIKASNRAKDMVGRILAFSRKALQVCISVDIFKVVVEALDMLRISAPSSIKIEKDLQDLEPGQYVRLRLSG
ncbi:hypothetical protein H8E50_02490, partial [bacterium]|nr:hypothetical protein [bacterium]